MFLKRWMPGHGRADPKVMNELRRLAIKAERLGKFATKFHKVISLTFVLRRLPAVFFPTGENVRSARDLSGKTLLTQITERLVLLLLFRQEPNAYYRLGLFMPERFPRAGEFIDFRQHSFLGFLLNQNKTSIITEDKLLFHDLCARNGLSSPPILGVLDPPRTDSLELAARLEDAARNGGVFFKLRFGLKARGIGRMQWLDADQWSLNIGKDAYSSISWRQVFDKLSAINEPLIFQKQLRNHPVLAKVNPSVLHTIRLVTFRDCDRICVLEALLRLGKKGSLTDNISVGGIGIPIDSDTRTLGKGVTMDTIDLPHSIQSLEPGGEKFVGLAVPFFEEAVALGIKVHELFPEIFSLGHDIAILPDGPVIMETNHIWGENQEIFDRGYGACRLFAERTLQIATSKIRQQE